MTEATLRRYCTLFLLGLALSGLLPFRFCPTAYASESKETAIDRVDSLFKFGETERAEQQALTILPRRDLNDDERVRLEVLLGSIYVAKNDTSGAYQAFQRALRVRPELTLNPNIFSPKILTVFERARRDWKPEHAFTQTEIAAIERTQLRARGYPEGLLLPGWGLLKQEKALHGTIFTIVEAGVLLGAVYGTVSTNQARKDYQNATATNANKRWTDYRDWYRRRNALWVAAGAIHALGWLDLAFGALPTPSKRVNFAITPDGIGMSFAF